MFYYARFRDTNGIIIEGIFDRASEIKALTGTDLSDLEMLNVLLFKLCGHTYTERKENLRNLAIDFQAAQSEESNLQLSYMEAAKSADFFRKNGRRYGLLREFQENAIC